MRAIVAGLCLSMIFGTAISRAQDAPAAASPQVPSYVQPDTSFVNCSGFYTDQKVPDEMRLISGEQSNYKLTFGHGDFVYINRGMNQGVRVGDRFSVVRPEGDPVKVNWFKWQAKLSKAMGAPYVDLGQLQVVKVQPTVSIATVSFSCEMMRRGDIIRPYVERPVGPFKEVGQFDHFAPASGKPVAMVVAGTDGTQLAGTHNTVYVNLGAAQGVKVGDYFRVFRYQGTRTEAAPNDKDFQYKLFGYGSNPQRYEWKDLPREVLGEGVVLTVSRNSSTVLITHSTIEIYAGDYVEIE